MERLKQEEVLQESSNVQVDGLAGVDNRSSAGKPTNDGVANTNNGETTQTAIPVVDVGPTPSSSLIEPPVERLLATPRPKYAANFFHSTPNTKNEEPDQNHRDASMEHSFTFVQEPSMTARGGFDSLDSEGRKGPSKTRSKDHSSADHDRQFSARRQGENIEIHNLHGGPIDIHGVNELIDQCLRDTDQILLVSVFVGCPIF